MFPNNIIKLFPRSFLALIAVLSLVSCRESDEPDPSPANELAKPAPMSERALLIYSVAANNLLPNLRADSLEMVQAAPLIENLGESTRVLLYFASGKGGATLSELRNDSEGGPCFRIVKTYPGGVSSVSPQRVGEVVSDLRYYRPAENYGLILESHGHGWTPDFNYSLAEEDSVAHLPEGLPGTAYSFGEDNTPGYRDSIDIDVLAACLPDGMFDFIWFDACYMAGVETVCEFRNKAHWFVGYVSEIMGDGMPYDLTLPLVARKQPDLQGAAAKLFDHYISRNEPVSVSVVDLSEMNALAKATSRVVSRDALPYGAWLQKYSRFREGPFYDFGQYVLTAANRLEKEVEDLDAFEQALERAVVYKAISPRDFNDNPVSLEDYSGLSCHLPGTSSEEKEAYYNRLSWTRTVYVE